MLLNLHVKNMALIRELDVDFREGLNILTGETGAGKSILIGSMNVALGMQSFKGFAREDSDSALVELVFSAEREEIRGWFTEHELPFDDGQIILSRRLTGARSISKVNGVSVPVSVIRELASLLIDIHGQHEHQSLLYRKNHLRILDEFAKEELKPWKERGKEVYSAYASLKEQLRSMTMDEASRRKEADFLQYELEEIENARLRPGEDAELEKQYRKLTNARRIAEDVGEAYELTSSGAVSASEMISQALQRLLAVSSYDEHVDNLAVQMAEVENLLSDVNREMSSYLEDLTFDEAGFAEVEERLDTLNHLKTKYGNSIEEVLAYGEEKRRRLEELSDYDVYLEKLEKEYREKEALLRDISKEMSAIREKHAERLAEKIRAELKDLNFLDTQFDVLVEQTDTLSANGFDEACFVMSMNPGAPKKPLGDVASGGELSRIMLAIKTVLADRDQTETLIFDEIDVGISGRTAQKVSEKMAVIAKSRQVLCITHLAQIASMANHHFYIEKTVHEQETQTSIRELAKEESLEELARILGGARITETTMQNAREMKEMADFVKQRA
ncbi:MAG: DNA repair protein RecN [Eubacteriales bacterium]|nr:DNA repair protein RecN [Eubacteriales bacterium]